MIEHCPSGLCRHTFGCSRLPGPPPSLSFACYGLFQSRNMFVDKTIKRERSSALDYHDQGQCDSQLMALNPVTFMVSNHRSLVLLQVDSTPSSILCLS